MPVARRWRLARATGPFTSKNCSDGFCDRSGCYRISNTPPVPRKSVSASTLAHILGTYLHDVHPTSCSRIANTRDIGRARLASGMPISYLTLGAAGEDDDRFLHDGRTRSTSISFGFG